MVVFVLPKQAKFNELTRHLKLYQEFIARTQMFTRQSLDDPTHQEVVAQAPWHVQLWVVDADYVFFDSAPTTVFDEPTSVHLPPNEHVEFIATVRHFFSGSYCRVDGPRRSSPATLSRAEREKLLTAYIKFPD
jgi:hypothetical protein